jgi:hypothetical protein
MHFKRGLRMTQDELGFVVTPDEIRGRMDALDALIAALGEAIDASKSKSINKGFRDAYASFVSRWLMFFGSTSEWGGRLFNSRWEPRYDDFSAAYARWWGLYASRKSESDQLPSRPAIEQHGPLDGISDELNRSSSAFALALGAAAVLGLLLAFRHER